MTIYDMINDLEDNEPKDRRTKDWKDWKILINTLMKNYNEKLHQKLYKLIK